MNYTWHCTCNVGPVLSGRDVTLPLTIFPSQSNFHFHGTSAKTFPKKGQSGCFNNDAGGTRLAKHRVWRLLRLALLPYGQEQDWSDSRTNEWLSNRRQKTRQSHEMCTYLSCSSVAHAPRPLRWIRSGRCRPCYRLTKHKRMDRFKTLN